MELSRAERDATSDIKDIFVVLRNLTSAARQTCDA